LPEHHPGGHDQGKPTAVGCVLTLLTLAVIFGVALPIMRWRDPQTGLSLQGDSAIYAPLVVGAIFHGIGTGLLRLMGLRIWSKTDKDDSASSER
jgi:hypothetical protein